MAQGQAWKKEEIRKATRAQALKHPNWDMGAKITIDSASMFNKGLEIMEARWLFDMPEDRIEVVVHPQSIVHSAVVFRDGAVLAQLGEPDMRVPIGYAMAYPERIETGVPAPDLFALGSLTFEKPDEEKFPALRLARECLRTGGAACTVFNGAMKRRWLPSCGMRFPSERLPYVWNGRWKGCPDCRQSAWKTSGRQTGSHARA